MNGLQNANLSVWANEGANFCMCVIVSPVNYLVPAAEPNDLYVR